MALVFLKQRWSSALPPTHSLVSVLSLQDVAVFNMLFACLRASTMKETNEAVSEEQAPPTHSPEEQVHDMTET